MQAGDGLGCVEHMGMYVHILSPHHHLKRRGFAGSRFGIVGESFGERGTKQADSGTTSSLSALSSLLSAGGTLSQHAIRASVNVLSVKNHMDDVENNFSTSLS